MIGQIVFDGVDDTEKLSADVKALEKQIHKIADEAYPSIKARGGGYQRIAIDTFLIGCLSLKVFVDKKVLWALICLIRFRGHNCIFKK